MGHGGDAGTYLLGAAHLEGQILTVTPVALGPNLPQTRTNLGQRHQGTSLDVTPPPERCHPNLPHPGAQPVPGLEERGDLVLQGLQHGAHLGGESRTRATLVSPDGWHPAHPQHPPHAPTSPCPQTQHRRCRLSGPQGDTMGTGCGGLLGGSPATCARRFICKDRHGGGHGDMPAPAWGPRCPQALGGATSLSTEPWPRAPCHHWGRGFTCAPLTLGSPPMSPGSAAVPKLQDPDLLAVPVPRNVPRLSQPAPPLPPSPPHPSDTGPSQGDGPHLVRHFLSKLLG